MRRIFEEHRAMGEAYRHDPRLSESIRNTMSDWVVEQHARLVRLAVWQRDFTGAIRIALGEGLYRPSSLAALWRRYRSIRAARSRLRVTMGVP